MLIVRWVQISEIQSTDLTSGSISVLLEYLIGTLKIAENRRVQGNASPNAKQGV
ncbi:MAG: hypothetical protein M2R46_04500 [Verrucomicrobia subdivision 3 bacterium]|nr:hypothetical protein [Limisphaerales bacterium]